MIPIFVKDIRCLTLIVPGDITIRNLKLQIERKWGYEPNSYTLNYSGKEFSWDNDANLSKYKIGKESTIYLSRRVCGD